MRSIQSAGSLLGALAGAAALFTWAAARAGEPSPPAGLPALAQSDQLAAGEQVFREICSVCHGEQGQGGDEAPTIIGPGNLLADYQTAKGLFDFIRENMPNDDPGSLQEQQYYDALAYLLSRNDFNPAGLPVNPTTLEHISLNP